MTILSQTVAMCKQYGMLFGVSDRTMYMACHARRYTFSQKTINEESELCVAVSCSRCGL